MMKCLFLALGKGAGALEILNVGQEIPRVEFLMSACLTPAYRLTISLIGQFESIVISLDQSFR